MPNDHDGSPKDLQFEYRIEPREGYVFVAQRGKATLETDVARMQREIERAMRSVGTRFAMFDNRDTARPDEWVRATMWSWLTESVDRAALLQTEVRNIKRAEERGERNRVTVRAFLEEAEAEAWLLAVR